MRSETVKVKMIRNRNNKKYKGPNKRFIVVDSIHDSTACLIDFRITLFEQIQ